VQINYIFFINERILFILQFHRSPNQPPNCLKRAKTSAILIAFDYVTGFCEVSAYTVAFFTMNQLLEKTISWSITVYNKNLSSQCNLTPQIEPVQDKKKDIFIIGHDT
jgi:hypothetical protein